MIESKYESMFINGVIGDMFGQPIEMMPYHSIK